MAKKNKPTFTGNSEHRKNFIKLLEQIAYDKSPWNVFNDFLQLAASTLSNQSDPYFLCTDISIATARKRRNSFHKCTLNWCWNLKAMSQMIITMYLEKYSTRWNFRINGAGNSSHRNTFVT